MKVRSHSLSTPVVRGIAILCAAVFVASAHTAQAETDAREAPAERAWWAFQQRAYPLGHIPAGAQTRALRQIHESRAAWSSTVGGAAAVDSERWISIGPARVLDKRPMSAPVAAIAVDPRDLQHWLIGAAQGGIWETRDGGTTWTPKTDDAASLAMGAIAFAPGNPDVIYAGTGDSISGVVEYGGAGLLKSIDSGATWQLLAAATFSGSSFSALRVDPNDARIVVATTRDRGFGRASFSELPLTPPAGIFKSADGGTTWSNRLIGRATALVVDRGNFSHQFAAIGSPDCSAGPLPCVGPAPPNAAQNGLYRSTDAGDNWTLIGGPWDSEPGGVGQVELALAPSNPNVLYVSIQDAIDQMAVGHDAALLGLWKTTTAWDPGPAWTQIDVKATDDGTGLYGYCGWSVSPNVDANGLKASCQHNHALLVDQSDADILYAAGVPLWRFDGTTWTEISRTADLQHGIHVDQQSLAWAGNRLIVGNDGGVWSTTDDGGTWTDHNTSLAITQFYKGALHPTNPNFALGGSQEPGFEKWTGADTWQYVFPRNIDGIDVAISSSQPDTQWALAAQFLDIYRAAVGSGGRVVVTPAGNGMDLTNAAFGSRFEKCPANENVFIAGTDNLWRTTNFFLPGSTWSANGPEMGECNSRCSSTTFSCHLAGCITAMGFAASDATCNTYAFATGDGRLRRTVNGGSSWDDLDASNAVPDRFVTDLAFAPTNANILYVTLSGFDGGTPGHPGHVFKSTSALAAAPTWLNVSPPADLPQNAVAVDPADPQVVYVGADIGVWKSTDGAGTWTHMGPESGMPNVAVFDLEIHPTVRRPFAFTYGRGAFALACRSDAECDDQNASNGVETCDLVSGRCLGSSKVCSDGSVAVDVVQPKLSMGKLNTPPGDDTLSLQGSLTLPSPFSPALPALDPVANGVRLVVDDGARHVTDNNVGNVLDVTIPGGAFARSLGKGWKVNKRGTTWTYQDKSSAPPDGIYKVVIQDQSSVTPGLVKFAVNGKAGSYAVASADLPVTVRMILAPPGGQCGDTSFATCAFNRSGSTLKCK